MAANNDEWIDMLLTFFYMGTLANIFRALPWLWYFRRFLISKKMMRGFIQHYRKTEDLVRKSVALQNS